MRQIANRSRDWSGYYARTLELPSSKHTRQFLEPLPLNARILDFGCGTGRWAKAFLRDRPDLSIDLVDQNLDAADISPTWKGDRFHTSFIYFRPAPNVIYDGIWAEQSLFFLPLHDMEIVFDRLAAALAPKGIFAFDMVDDCESANKAKFTGMKKDKIDKVLAKNDLQALTVKRQEIIYGSGEGIAIPTHVFCTQKKVIKPSYPVNKLGYRQDSFTP